jgi:tetratricopeptide (TPR) repeat protein
VIAALVTGILAAAGAGFVGWLLGRRAVESRAAGLESRLALLEEAAGRKYRERLASMRRRLGFVYLDGLPTVADQEVADMFEAGARHATSAEWDRAGERWTKAQARATGAEVVALRVLCGVCRLLLDQPEKARVEFDGALAASRAAQDRAGEAVSLLALGVMAGEQGVARDAGRYLDNCVRLSRRLGLNELEAAALVRLAELAEGAKEYDRALVFHRQALRAMEASGDRVGAVRQFGAAGEVLFRQGELDKARAAHEDGLLLARQVSDRFGEAERLAAIGVIHRIQGDAPRALEVLERAFHIYEEIHQPRPQARLLYELALIHEQLGEPDAAHEYHERSLVVARNVGDRSLQARNLEQMAEHCLAQGAFEQARTMFEEAAQLDREDSRKRELCHDLTGVGRALLRLGRADDAIKSLTGALALCEELADQKAEAWVSLYLAQAQRAAGLSTEALQRLERGQALARRLGEDGILAATLAEAAVAHAAQRDWPKATAAAQAAAELHRKLNDTRAQARDLVGIGVALRHQSRPDEAKSRLEEGLRLAHSSADPDTEAWSLFEMAAVNRALGNAALARENLRRSLQLREDEGDLRGEAECLLELGRLHAEAREVEAARSRLDQAARLFVKLDERERAAEAASVLAGLPGSGGGVQILGQ